MNNMDVLNDQKINLDIDSHIETLGEFLRYHREQKQFSLEELSKKTKIRIQQLVYLEQNNFMALPNQVYLKGFVKSICNELDISVELALNYLNDNTLAEDALEFLKPGKEIKPLHFNFKFFDKSKIKVNQKLLLAFVAAFALGGSVISNIRFDWKNETTAPSIVHKRMNIFEANKLIQTDAVTDLIPPDGLGYTVDRAPAGQIVPQNKTMLNNDMIDGKKVLVQPENQTVVQEEPENTPAVVEVKASAPVVEVKPVVQPVIQPVIQPVVQPAVQPATVSPVPADSALPQSQSETPTKVTVTAKDTAFLVYRVNGEKKNKIYLRKGKTLELEGSEIRMDVGNPDAVEFTKNGEPLQVKAEQGSSTLHLEFPTRI